VAHTCNPSCSRGRDQEDCCSNYFGRLYLKNPSPKRAGVLSQGVGPEFKSHYRKTNLKVKRCFEHSKSANNEIGYLLDKVFFLL
jgi:hypothetical protein